MQDVLHCRKAVGVIATCAPAVEARGAAVGLKERHNMMMLIRQLDDPLADHHFLDQ